MSIDSPVLKTMQGRQASALEAALAGAARRIRLLKLLRYGALALCVTALAGLLVVGLSKLRLIEMPSPWLLAGAIGVGLLVGIALAFLRPLTDLEVARLTEQRADLKERLSSAVEFRQQGLVGAGPFYAAQLVDADHHAAGVNLKHLYPLRLPRTLFIGLPAALALFLTYYLPTLPAFWSARQREEMAEVKRQGIQIERLAQDTTKAADQQKLDATKKAAMEAQKLGEAMRKGDLNKKQALVAMQKLTRKMEETQKRLAASQPTKPMEQAQSEFKRSLDRMQQEIATSQQKRAEQARQSAKNAQGKKDSSGKKEGQNNVGKEQPKPKESEAMKQARKALEQMQQAMQRQDARQMQQAMQQLAQQIQSGQMSSQEMQQLQQAMQQLAQALQNTSQNKASQLLQQLAQEMQTNLNKMDASTLQQMAQLMKDIAAQMGKAQMGKGDMQAMMDLKALQDLIQALKEGRLTLALGKGFGKGNMPGMGGKGPGRGWAGSGGPTNPMKDPGNKAKAHLMTVGENNGKPGKGKAGSAQELAKYLAMTSKSSKYLPNAKVAGQRLQNGQELQQNMTGDPEAFKSNSPYYQVYQTNRRAAENALNKENIPAAYKKQVRDYFDSIKP